MTAPLIIPASALSSDCCAPVTPPAAAPDASVVTNDGWFPDIALAHFRGQVRIRDSVTVDRQRGAIIGAIMTVGNDLVAWAAARRTAGAANLATVVDVPNPVLDGEPALLHLYRRAVYAYAKADLVERYRDIDTTTAGQRKADELDASVDELRRDGSWAVRDMLGRTRTTVELI
jgi:hypothetical protein